MAILNEILVARYARQLQKLFGIKGGAPTKQLSGEIMAMFQLFSGAENRYLESWNRFGYRALQGGVSGQIGMIRLRNPASSNVMVVIEKLTYTTASATDQIFFRHGPVTTDLTNLFQGSTQRLDARSGTQQLASLIVSQAAAASVSSFGNPIYSHPSNTANAIQEVIFTPNQEITVLPGDGLQLDQSTTNAGLYLSLFWRERLLEESERT